MIAVARYRYAIIVEFAQVVISVEYHVNEPVERPRTRFL